MVLGRAPTGAPLMQRHMTPPLPLRRGARAVPAQSGSEKLRQPVRDAPDESLRSVLSRHAAVWDDTAAADAGRN